MPEHDDDAVLPAHLDADDGLAETVAAWSDAKALARKYSDEEKALRRRILESVTDPAGVLPDEIHSDGRRILTIKRIESTRLDIDALRAQAPSIWQQYARSSWSTRVSAP